MTLHRAASRARAAGWWVLLAFATGCRTTSAPDPVPLLPGTLLSPSLKALTGVNVVDVESGAIARDQTLLVSNERIAAIGPRATMVVPESAQVIDGRQRLWVIPGLVDVHAHVFESREFLVYLSQGITTVRNLHGVAAHLAWRDRLTAGKLTGPRLITAGAIIDGDPPGRSTNVVVRDVASARAEVRRQATLGYDLLKLYDNIGLAPYRAVVDEARAVGLPVTGHLPTPVGLDSLLAGPHQGIIEHLEELLPLFGPTLSDGDVDVVAHRLATAGIAVVPTMVVFDGAARMAEDWPALQRRPEAAYVTRDVRAMFRWTETAAERQGRAAAAAFFRGRLSFMQRVLLPALDRAGVVVLPGADAPIPPLVPGYAYTDELFLMMGAGLSPRQVLTAATAGAARALGREGDFGRIRVGLSADLVLLAENPLADPTVLKAPVGVMTRGRWYARRMLKASADSIFAAIP